MSAERIAESAVDKYDPRCEIRRKPWLGRLDSNQRMAVPKTASTPCRTTIFQRNSRVVHRLESIAYGRFAEDLPPPGLASERGLTTMTVGGSHG